MLLRPLGFGLEAHSTSIDLDLWDYRYTGRWWLHRSAVILCCEESLDFGGRAAVEDAAESFTAAAAAARRLSD
jgi:hypothetical protein